MFLTVEDWRCDQYRWFNNGVKELPKSHPTIKKTYFICDTPDGTCSAFKKYSYELLLPNGYTLIHYIGDERVANDFSHGNSKSSNRKFVRTCPSVMHNLDAQCSTSTTSNVYRTMITDTSMSIPSTHIPVLKPRDSQQVENVRNRKLKEKRIGHDSLYNLHEIATDNPSFIHKIETYPDMVCVCGRREILNEFEKVLLLQSPSSQLLSYDTTFQLGDFYVSALVFRHTLFQEAPIIPAMFLLHERKFQQCHQQLFQEAIKHVPALKSVKHPMVTDEEKGIVNAVEICLPNIVRVRCWNHIIRDVTRWLRAHGAPSLDVQEYISDIRGLFHKPSRLEYDMAFIEMKKKWSAPFLDYYQSSIHTYISSIGRWILEEYGVYNPYGGVTSNQSESLNCLLKHLCAWKECPVDCMVLAFYHLQCYYELEITRGQHNMGNYHLHACFTGMFDDQSIPQIIVYSPEDIVKQLKGELVSNLSTNSCVQDTTQQRHGQIASQESRAKRLLEEGKVVHNPSLKVFTVMGTDRPHAVTLFPKETCTCPSTVRCYHIMAARMSVGINDESNPKQWNLTQLRRNARSCKEKKSGRKRPRPGDYDCGPAPDAVSETPNDATDTGIHSYKTITLSHR